MSTATTAEKTTILHQLTESDVTYCNHRDRGRFTGLRQCFNSWIADGETAITILHEDGLYRHMRFSAPGTLESFEIITWPGSLTVSGGHGTWTFRRNQDMFTFFTGYINVDYWAEKLVNGCHGGRQEVKHHDDETFRDWVIEDFWETSRDLDHDDTIEWWQSLKDEVFDDFAMIDTEDPHECLRVLQDNVKAPRHHYRDIAEVADSWAKYDWHFEMSLAMIVTGIRTYREHQASREAEAA